MAVTALADHALHGPHGEFRLALEHDHDLATVRARPVEHEEIREPRHRDAEIRPRLVRPMVLQRPAATTDDAEAGEVVRRLEPGRHNDDIDGSLLALGVDDARAGHRRHGAGDQLHVVLLERGIEGAGEDRPLARIGIRRRDRLAQVRAIGELAVDVAEAELVAGLVDLGARPVEAAAPQALLQQVLQPPSLPPAAPRLGEGGARSSVRSRSPLGMIHPGSRWNT